MRLARTTTNYNSPLDADTWNQNEVFYEWLTYQGRGGVHLFGIKRDPKSKSGHSTSTRRIRLLLPGAVHTP